jgi:F5/8 type C domain
MSSTPPPQEPPKVVKEIEIVHNGTTFKFQIVLVAETPGNPPPPGPQPMVQIPISKAESNRDDGNVATNVINADAARWSCKGTDCELKLDLGHVNDVGQVAITFYKGGERTENFEVGFSDNDQTYVFVSESQQEAATAVININPFIKARYIKVLGKGNSVNYWNSIEHVKVSGTVLPGPPPPEPCPPGQHRDAAGNCVPDEQPCEPGFHRDPTTGECIPDNQPPPTGGIIEEGVKMLYPKIGNAIKFKYGSSNEGRAQWSTDNGKCMVNQEVTAILNIHPGAVENDGEEISLKLRGGRHSDSDPDEGSCYIIGIDYQGKINAQWEEPHPSNHAFPTPWRD